MTIGERISCLRVKRNMSQSELAGALGVSRIMVSRWENDVSRPSGKNLLRICSFFEINSDYFADCDAAEETGCAEVAEEEVEMSALLLELRTLRQELARKERRDFGWRKRIAVILLLVFTLFFVAMTISIGMALHRSAGMMYGARLSPFENTEFTIVFIFSVLFGLGTAAVAIFWRDRSGDRGGEK